MKLIYFDILPDEGLEYFYLWKVFDGSYTAQQDDDDGEEQDDSTTPNDHRLLQDLQTDNSTICEP